MWTAEDISFNENGFAAFTVLKDNERITNIQLKVPGIHNISNVLASIAACYALGCSIENIKKGLESYTGIHRRFELKGIENNIKVVDDYAHHPSEIKATLRQQGAETIRESGPYSSRIPIQEQNFVG